MAKKKEPKTMIGMLRKEWTGDGRKRVNTAIAEEWGKRRNDRCYPLIFDFLLMGKWQKSIFNSAPLT
jgi:hypothetical protein